MSVCVFLIPLAVAVVTAAVEGGAAVVYACEQAKKGQSEKIATKFASHDLLIETLDETGVAYQERTENCIEASFEDGKIIYEKSDVSQPYTMQITGVSDMDKLICTVEEIDKMYDSNVQQYTYNRVKNNLPDSMVIASEEILEDNSILMTLNVE